MRHGKSLWNTQVAPMMKKQAVGLYVPCALSVFMPALAASIAATPAAPRTVATMISPNVLPGDWKRFILPTQNHTSNVATSGMASRAMP